MTCAVAAFGPITANQGEGFRGLGVFLHLVAHVTRVGEGVRALEQAQDVQGAFTHRRRHCWVVPRFFQQRGASSGRAGHFQV